MYVAVCNCYHKNSCGLLESEATQCDDPGVPDNGRRIGNDLDIGSVIYFQCFDGYELVGERSIVCQPGAGWSACGPFYRIITGKDFTLFTIVYSLFYFEQCLDHTNVS